MNSETEVGINCETEQRKEREVPTDKCCFSDPHSIASKSEIQKESTNSEASIFFLQIS
jgi:hypothetical protein